VGQADGSASTFDGEDDVVQVSDAFVQEDDAPSSLERIFAVTALVEQVSAGLTPPSVRTPRGC
jgi:hypothetical protein